MGNSASIGNSASTNLTIGDLYSLVFTIDNSALTKTTMDNTSLTDTTKCAVCSKKNNDIIEYNCSGSPFQNNIIFTPKNQIPYRAHIILEIIEERLCNPAFYEGVYPEHMETYKKQLTTEDKRYCVVTKVCCTSCKKYW